MHAIQLYRRFSLTNIHLDRGRETRQIFDVSSSPVSQSIRQGQESDLPLPTFHFDCKHRPEDIDDASLDRGGAGASRKDFAAAGWLQPRSTFQSRNRSSHGSTVVRGSRKGDSVWVVALSGREPRSFSSPRWLSRMEDR